MEHEGHKHHEHGKNWQSDWKSPVSLGIFLFAASIALAIAAYTLLGVAGALMSAFHAPASQQMMSPAEMQQLQQ